jgi:hypothetical protein
MWQNMLLHDTRTEVNSFWKKWTERAILVNEDINKDQSET